MTSHGPRTLREGPEPTEWKSESVTDGLLLEHNKKIPNNIQLEQRTNAFSMQIMPALDNLGKRWSLDQYSQLATDGKSEVGRVKLLLELELEF